ncbi:MAG: hypothetical protein ACI8PZ_001009 [Myxococcota bacterium]|jgi:hypothetical protein
MRLAMLLTVLVGCTEYNVSGKKGGATDGSDTATPAEPAYGGECPLDARPGEFVGVDDYCWEDLDPDGFTPEVEWIAGEGRSSRATPAVADLDGDGRPELIANLSGFIGTSGSLVVFEGDGSGKRWEATEDLGYGSSPAVGDVDGDGQPEIAIVRALGSQFPLGNGTYAVVLYEADGTLKWQSAEFSKLDFNYATGTVISDMDHDGSPEIIAGRVILNADGSTRGVGEFGQGSWGKMPPNITEGSFSAVTDLDLDGVEEVVVGNAVYAPDGTAIWSDPREKDGIPAIANLDDDPYGEVVISTFDTVRAHDHTGRVMWGPYPLDGANIVSAAAIADVDVDGRPEVIVAGGNQLVALNHDGTLLWSVAVRDASGASGPSIFDFEGDGIPEVVYADEDKLIAVDGRTGATKFYTTDHSSDTMMEYPVIADIDADGEAEIIVSHVLNGRAISVYGSGDFETWEPGRRVWNQHAYSINNVSDDLTLPLHQEPNFTTHNTWHSALADPRLPDDLKPDVGGEVLRVCDDDCGSGVVMVEARLLNKGPSAIEGPVALTLYAVNGGDGEFVATIPVLGTIDGGWSSESVWFEVPTEVATGAEGFTAWGDDDGTGAGLLDECSERNNHGYLEHASCR